MRFKQSFQKRFAYRENYNDEAVGRANSLHSLMQMMTIMITTRLDSTSLSARYLAGRCTRLLYTGLTAIGREGRLCCCRRVLACAPGVLVVQRVIMRQSAPARRQKVRRVMSWCTVGLSMNVVPYYARGCKVRVAPVFLLCAIVRVCLKDHRKVARHDLLLCMFLLRWFHASVFRSQRQPSDWCA